MIRAKTSATAHPLWPEPGAPFQPPPGEPCNPDLVQAWARWTPADYPRLPEAMRVNAPWWIAPQVRRHLNNQAAQVAADLARHHANQATAIHGTPDPDPDTNTAFLTLTKPTDTQSKEHERMTIAPLNPLPPGLEPKIHVTTDEISIITGCAAAAKRLRWHYTHTYRRRLRLPGVHPNTYIADQRACEELRHQLPIVLAVHLPGIQLTEWMDPHPAIIDSTWTLPGWTIDIYWDYHPN